MLLWLLLLCVCVCVCVRDRERDRERNMDKLNFITVLKLRYNPHTSEITTLKYIIQWFLLYSQGYAPSITI